MAKPPAYTLVSVPCPFCKASLPAQVSMTGGEGYTVYGTLSYSAEFWGHIKGHREEADRG